MTGFRLPSGGRVDRDRTLRFSFDGRDLTGVAGDTLASALLANGQHLVGRSFKYHRPRGIVSAGAEEPCALVALRDGARREPNAPATTVELYDGLVARSQNRWPSLRFDLLTVNDLLAPFLPAGFYYKTFMRPHGWWEKVYEPLIRRAAGLGSAPDAPDPDRYEHVHAHCDVLVVGAGPAGLAAAGVAVAAGARVILAEADFEAGGGALLDRAAASWAEASIAALPQGVLRRRTTVVSAYGHGVFAAVERVADHEREPAAPLPRQRLHLIRTRRAILAMGAVERLIPFPGNDRPGVMLAAAALTYARRFGVGVGRHPAMFTLDDTGHDAAVALAESGVVVEAIFDPRPEGAGAARARAAGLRVHQQHEVCATRGRSAVSGVVARQIGRASLLRTRCDALLVCGGWSPESGLAVQAGLPMAWDDGGHAFVPREGHEGVVAVGGARGVAGLMEAARDGASAAHDAVLGLGLSPGAIVLPIWPEPERSPPAPMYEVRGRGKAFVDLQHDVTADDLRLATREGYGHAEHAKRYTTHGMATDQGRIGGMAGAAVLAAARGVHLQEVGLSKPRPFTRPVAWGTLAGSHVGQHFKPERRLPLHEWHAASDATFARIGLWLRPLVYSSDTGWEPVLEEARNVRRSVGICDVSSLGKVDVQGPDAARFLDLIYANTFSTLAKGRARYGIMLREDGMVLDDGTTSRLADDHFIMTTTTQKADDVLAHMEWHLATVWPQLDVTLTDVADHWAQFAVAGPRAREVLLRVVDRDLADPAFPFMAACDAMIAGVAGRVFRISFSGELAYEVSVPAGYARHVWCALLAAGASYGMRPYGLDALNVLRIEKGHVTGAEINGQTTAGDLGLGRMLKKRGDFVGRALAQRPGLADAARLQLVGLRPANAAERLRSGAHLRNAQGEGTSLGYVTSACMRAEGEGWIGLGLLAGGAARHGEMLVADSPIHGESARVVVGSPHFLDPENARVRA